MNNELTNWQKAILDEIDDVLHDNYDDYETGIEIDNNRKIYIANEILNNDYEIWEDLRMIIMNYINEELKARLDYLRQKRNVCLTFDKGEDYEFETLELWERGEL